MIETHALLLPLPSPASYTHYVSLQPGSNGEPSEHRERLPPEAGGQGEGGIEAGRQSVRQQEAEGERIADDRAGQRGVREEVGQCVCGNLEELDCGMAVEVGLDQSGATAAPEPRITALLAEVSSSEVGRTLHCTDLRW